MQKHEKLRLGKLCLCMWTSVFVFFLPHFILNHVVFPVWLDNRGGENTFVLEGMGELYLFFSFFVLEFCVWPVAGGNCKHGCLGDGRRGSKNISCDWSSRCRVTRSSSKCSSCQRQKEENLRQWREILVLTELKKNTFNKQIMKYLFGLTNKSFFLYINV